ncbi:MAG: hypothetical protein EA427_06140 [Spirochaetaceae bacterium]|nr:MAG: hypothetical protein EA427_06140 [Spirochaetaceae bacterium]
MPAESGFERLITRNSRLLQTYAVARDYSGSGRPLLLVGEAGTGRRLLARALSEENGGTGPVLEREAPDVNRQSLQSVPPEATLHIRNVARLPRDTQEHLVTALRDASDTTVPRLVFSSLPDLPVRISSGDFLPELYYLLSACEVHLPPLREREGDLPVLIEYFCRRTTETLGMPRLRVDAGFLNYLGQYPFPGNVAELEMVMHKAVFWTQDQRLSEEAARATLENHALSTVASQIMNSRHTPLTQLIFPSQLPTVAAARKQLIMEALRRSEGNQSQAARVLGLTPPAINKFLNRLENEA